MKFSIKKDIFQEIPLLEEYINKSKLIKPYTNNFLYLNESAETINSEFLVIKNIQKKLNKYPDIIIHNILSLFQSNVDVSRKGNTIIITYPYSEKFEIYIKPFSKENTVSFNISFPKDFSLLDSFNKVHNDFLKDIELYKNKTIFASFLYSLKFIQSCKLSLEKILQEYYLNSIILNNKNKYYINRIKQTLKKNNFKRIDDFIFTRKDQIQDKVYEEHFYTCKFDLQHLQLIKHTLKFYRDKETQKIIYKIKQNGTSNYNEILDILNESVNIGEYKLKSNNSLIKIGLKINNNGRIPYQEFFNSKINTLHNVDSF